MILDALLRVSDTQAFGAAAVSTNSIDLGNVTPKREVGTGEPMGFLVAVDIAATVAAPIVEVISATDAALTAGILVHSSVTTPLAQAIAGKTIWADLPMGTPTQRYLGIRVTTAGGTITASAWLAVRSQVSIPPQHYAKAFNV